MKAQFFFLLCLLSAMAYSQELAKYQKKSKGNFEVMTLNDINNYLKVDLVNVTKPEPYVTTTSAPAVKRSIFNLSERGQKALIETLGTMVNNDKNLLDDLAKPLEKSSDEGNPIEVKVTDLISRFDIKVDNQSLNKANRIDQLEIWVTLADNDEVEFTGFSNFASKYKSIDFGTLSVSRVTGFTANAGINLGGTGAATTTTTNGGQTTTMVGTDDNNNTSNQTNNGVTNANGTTTSNASNIGLGFSTNKTVAQQIAIKSDIVMMKGTLSGNEFSIFQNGAPNQDLEDNINVNVICRPKKNTMQSYFIIKGLFNPESNAAIVDPTKITIKTGYISCPQITADVSATISYAFVYRWVIRGENTVRESDDVVKFLYTDNRNLTKKEVIIFKKDQLTTKLYAIKSGTNNKELYINYYGNKRPLYFADNISALQFIEWLRQTNSTSVKGFGLFLSQDSMSFDAYALADVSDLQFLEKKM